MNMKFILLVAALLLGGGVATAATLRKRESDYEPAPPTAAPPSTGGSGIASTDDEVEALARVISSEAGSGSSAEQRAIAWTVRNRFRGKSIYDVQYPWRAQRGANPPFSSARPAKDMDRAMAREVIAADQSEDPTGGATSFFEPRMQDAFAKAGSLARAGETGDRVVDGVKLTNITRFKNYKKSADQLRTSWSPGSTMYATAGRFEFWGSARLFAQRGGTIRAIAGIVEACGIDLVERQAVAWALRNRMARTDDIDEAIAGYPMTDPSEESQLVSTAIMTLPDADDPTGGAVDFWRPDVQDIVHVLGGVHTAAISGGDLAMVDALMAYADSPSELDARESFALVGLVTCGVAGGLELLGETTCG